MESNVITKLENEIELLEKPQTEKELRVSPQLRQVRLDVELDVSLLEPGSINFNLLNNSCFILIAPFDIFGRGLYRYTFEGTCRECPDLKLGDGAVRIFINTKGTNREDFSREFLDFMRYVTETTDAVTDVTESSRIKLIKQVCKKLAKNETPEKIAEDLEEKISTILPICELAEEFAPEYDSEKVYEKYCVTFPYSS